jgi:hypothetical protein
VKCPHCGGDIGPALAAAGGKARAAKLSKAKRSEIAKKAAQKRWQGHKKAKP